jgi:hypothetical protein
MAALAGSPASYFCSSATALFPACLGILLAGLGLRLRMPGEARHTKYNNGNQAQRMQRCDRRGGAGRVKSFLVL